MSEALGVLSGIVQSFVLVSIFGRINRICFYSVWFSVRYTYCDTMVHPKRLFVLGEPHILMTGLLKINIISRMFLVVKNVTLLHF